MAMEALVNNASGAGVKCLTVEAQSNRAFLEDTNEITFNDKDMEVNYPDHRRSFYLVASINQILIKQALVDTGVSVNLIPLSTLQAVGYKKRRVHGWIHTVLAKSRPSNLLGPFPCGKDRGLVPLTIGTVMVA